MVYKKRINNRKFEDTRPMEAKVGVVKNADGSAYFKIGNTVAYAAVYGPREVFPRFMSNPKKGILKCHYNMLPFSGTGERIRPGNKRRSQEISMVMKKALEPVIDLSAFPNSMVEIFVEFPQTDAGTRCAGICAASIALADAGLKMKDMVASVSVGRVDEAVLVDLNYEEEAFDGEVADVPLAFLQRSKEVSLLQMDGAITEQQLFKAIEMGQKACDKIHVIQQKALKDKYKV